jgi:hypothetical protein
VDVSRPVPDSQVLKVEPALPGLELSARINAVLGRLRDARGNYPTCFVVRQGARAPPPRRAPRRRPARRPAPTARSSMPAGPGDCWLLRQDQACGAVRPYGNRALAQIQRQHGGQGAALHSGLRGHAARPEQRRQLAPVPRRACPATARHAAARRAASARAGTPPEQHVLPYLVEDRGPGTPSYQDFATMLHRAVLSKG